MSEISNYCKEINFLPTVPDKFLLNAVDIRKLPCLTPQLLTHGYGNYLANNEIHDFLQPYFKNPIKVRYQLILSDRPYHTDICKEDEKYNYIYKTGGDEVLTTWKDMFDTYSIICKPNVWYNLKIKISHKVTGISTPRCSITIKVEKDVLNNIYT